MLTHSRRQKFQIVKEHNKLKLVKKFLSNKTSINTNIEFGGARRDRTADLLRARQALSQLSYGPNQGTSLSGPVEFVCVFIGSVVTQ